MDVKDEIAEIIYQDGDAPIDLAEKCADKIISIEIPEVVEIDCPECCPNCHSETGMKFPANNSAYCEDCGYPDEKRELQDGDTVFICKNCKGTGKFSPSIQTAIDEYKKNHGEGK